MKGSCKTLPIIVQAEALTRFAEAERVRREMHNEIMDLKGAIRVFVRVRPAADEAQSAVRIGAGGSLELQTAQGRNSSVTTFSYDRVFAPSAPQAWWLLLLQLTGSSAGRACGR